MLSFMAVASSNQTSWGGIADHMQGLFWATLGSDMLLCLHSLSYSLAAWPLSAARAGNAVCVPRRPSDMGGTLVFSSRQ